MSTFRFQLPKCEHMFNFFGLYNSKLNVFAMRTKQDT